MEHYEQWENIDQQYMQIKVDAEQQCWKIHASQVPWTLILTQANDKILYWKGINKRILGSKIGGTVLKKRAAQGVGTFQLEQLNLCLEVVIKK